MKEELQVATSIPNYTLQFVDWRRPRGIYEQNGQTVSAIRSEVIAEFRQRGLALEHVDSGRGVTVAEIPLGLIARLGVAGLKLLAKINKWRKRNRATASALRNGHEYLMTLQVFASDTSDWTTIQAAQGQLFEVWKALSIRLKDLMGEGFILHGSIATFDGEGKALSKVVVSPDALVDCETFHIWEMARSIKTGQQSSITRAFADSKSKITRRSRRTLDEQGPEVAVTH